jgi:hypothetical protein
VLPYRCGFRSADNYRPRRAVSPDSAGGPGTEDAGMPRTASEGATMKISLISVAIAAIVCAGAFGTGKALATTTHQTAPRTLKIAMHDPGCHWFMRNGHFTKKATVSGRVRLMNMDEATLKVASRSGMRHIAVGKALVVGQGHYVIMMVGQAPDDNYLTLNVR